MSRTVVRLVIVALALSAASLAVGTGASVLSGPTDPVAEDVTLSPASGANGDYAYLADGELVVDLTPANPNLDGDGPSADGVATLDDVFVIHYGGERFARVWLTHDSDSVTLRADGRPIQSESNATVLAANESTSVGLRVDTTGRTDGLLEEVTVHASVADPEDVSPTAGTDADAPTRDSDGGERSIRSFSPDASTRTFTVTNAPVGTPVTLDTDRLVVDSVETRTLTLDELVVTSDARATSVDVRVVDGSDGVDTGPGVAPLGALEVDDGGTVTGATFRFSVDPTYLDEHGVSVDDLVVRRNDGSGWHSLDPDAVGTRNGRPVFEADSPGFSRFVVGVRTPSFRLGEVRLNRTTAAPGESVSVTVSVWNDGLAAGERTIPLTVGGDRVANRTVSLAPGASTTVRFDVSRASPGRYVIGLNGTDAGALVVETDPATTPAATPRSTAIDEDAGPDDASMPPTTWSFPAVHEPGAFRPSAIAGAVGLPVALVLALLAVRNVRNRE